MSTMDGRTTAATLLTHRLVGGANGGALLLAAGNDVCEIHLPLGSGRHHVLDASAGVPDGSGRQILSVLLGPAGLNDLAVADAITGVTVRGRTIRSLPLREDTVV